MQLLPLLILVLKYSVILLLVSLVATYLVNLLKRKDNGNKELEPAKVNNMSKTAIKHSELPSRRSKTSIIKEVGTERKRYSHSKESVSNNSERNENKVLKNPRLRIVTKL